jgi:histidine triad (HIT) family protein
MTVSHADVFQFGITDYSHIASPWRLEMEDCVFCRIVKGDLPCFKIFEDDRVLGFADINPISRGHSLVIPKAHTENLLEISEKDLFAVYRAARSIASAITRIFGPAGIACVQLNGREVNQVVMHYHLHLIPRVEGGPSLPVCEWEPAGADMDETGKIAAEIASAVEAQRNGVGYRDR